MIMIQKLLKMVYLVVMTASLSLLGQDSFDEIAKRKGYGKAEITLKDGTTKKGYIASHYFSNGIMRYNEKDHSNIWALSNETLYFFENPKLGFKKVHLKEVKYVVFSDYEDPTRLSFHEKLEVVRYNSKGQKKDKRDLVLLPLMIKGKLNLYGVTLNQRVFDGYLRLDSETDAYMPYDIGVADVFNMKKFRSKFYHVIKEVIKDCPEFNAMPQDELLDKYFSLYVSIKEYGEQTDNMLKESWKIAKQTGKTRSEKLEIALKNNVEKSSEGFRNFVTDFNEKCTQP